MGATTWGVAKTKIWKATKTKKWNGWATSLYEGTKKQSLHGDMKGVLIYPLFFTEIDKKWKNTCFAFSYRNRKICTHRRWRRRRNFRPTSQRPCSLIIRDGLYGLLSWKRNLTCIKKHHLTNMLKIALRAENSTHTFFNRER